MPNLETGNPNCFGSGSPHVLSIGFADWRLRGDRRHCAKVMIDGGGNAKRTYNAAEYKGIAFWAPLRVSPSRSSRCRSSILHR